MSDQSAFDVRLGDLYAHWVEAAPTGMNARETAIGAIERARTHPVRRWPQIMVARRTWLNLAAAGLVLVFIATVAFVGSRLNQVLPPASSPTPSAVPSPVPTVSPVAQVPPHVTIRPIGSLRDAYDEPRIVALPGGRALVVSAGPTGDWSTYLVDTASAGVSPAGKLPAAVSSARMLDMTPLDDGRILIVGYQDGEGTGGGVSIGAVFDPVTGDSVMVGPTAFTSAEAAMTRMADGRVLIAGGLRSPDSDGILADAEIFDPRSMTFSRTAPMTVARSGHSMVLLDDGRVLVVGGSCANGQPTWCQSVETFDPTAETFSRVGSMQSARGESAPMARTDGRLIIVRLGRYSQENQFFGRHGVDPVSTEVFDPSTNTFEVGPPVPHTVDTAASLGNGQLLLTGKWDVLPQVEAPDAGTSDTWVSLFDPISGDVEELHGVEHAYWAATGLDNGSVVLVEALDYSTADPPPNAIDVITGN